MPVENEELEAQARKQFEEQVQGIIWETLEQAGIHELYGT